jgi:aldose 1-epimerase
MKWVDNESCIMTGFPGNVSVMVTYMFIGHNELALKMEAKALNKATPINLASHTYWNLRGHNTGDILSHEVQIFGSHITPVDDKLIPTGEITSVKGTSYDFLSPRTIGSKFNELPVGMISIMCLIGKVMAKLESISVKLQL